MDDGILKFLVDAGSLGILAIICFFFCKAIVSVVQKFVDYIDSVAEKQEMERRFYIENLISVFKDSNKDK